MRWEPLFLWLSQLSLSLFFAPLFAILLTLSSCVPPVYENTTFGIKEFTTDSKQIKKGKYAITTPLPPFSNSDPLNLSLEETEKWNTLTDKKELKVINGDELSITLYCPRRPDFVIAFETINGRLGFCVNEGLLSLPSLPPIDVEGLTLIEIKELIQKAYQEQLPDVTIYVNFKKKRERFVQVIGAKHSIIALNEEMRLNEVLAKAKLSPYANLFCSIVTRNGIQLPVDLYRLIHEGDSTQNIVMEEGDQIFIANVTAASVMVTGEVIRPLVIPIPYGFISLREALGIASGIPFTGDKSSITVIRGDLVKPKIYTLAWKEILHVPNEALLLMAGDIVFISENKITQWNRFINQIQPSANCMQTTYNIYEAINAQN